MKKNSLLKVVIPPAKLFVLSNSIRTGSNLFNQNHMYNNSIKDCRSFYMIYIRPIIDIWIFIIPLEQQLQIIENRLIRPVMQTPRIASGNALIKKFGIMPIKGRMIKTAKSFLSKNVFHTDNLHPEDNIVLRFGLQLQNKFN